MKILSVEMYIPGQKQRRYEIGNDDVIEISEMPGDEAYGPFLRIKFEDERYREYSDVPYMVEYEKVTK